LVLAVSGLAREAAIAGGPGTRALAGAGPRLEGLLDQAIAAGAAGVISFGIAGGLDPRLVPGTSILAGAVLGQGQRWPVDPVWRARLAARLPGALACDLAGIDSPLLAEANKRELYRATGACAVDMESHLAARRAQAAGLPFAALRIVCDPASRRIPRAAIAGMRDDGRTDLGAIVGALLSRPGDLPDFVRLAWDAQLAFGTLQRCRRAVGQGWALLPLEEA